MMRGVLVLAALLASPASAFLCQQRWLAGFAVFPLAALAERRWRYFRNLLVVGFAPLALLVWASSVGDPDTAARSLKWLAAVSSGLYFAAVLGPGGIASVIGGARSFPPAVNLSRTMLQAGGSAAAAGDGWSRGADLSVTERLAKALKHSMEAEPLPVQDVCPGILPSAVAAVSWGFLLLSASGAA